MAPETFSYDLKIPKDRVPVLIGSGGKVKRDLEQSTKTKITVDSHEGDVMVMGEDAITLYTLREVIRAIGRGFNPEIAQLLMNPTYLFEMISIKDFAKTKKDEIRLKGRIIGQEGKSRKVIEELTECSLCVYGKTVCIIGEIEKVPNARRAIELLLTGSPHANVFQWLEKQADWFSWQKS